MSFTPRTIVNREGKLSRKNTSGADIGANLAVTYDTANDDGFKLPAAVDDPIMGVTCNVIKAGDWGDILVEGGSIVPVLNQGGVTRGQRLMIDTSGRAVTFAAAGGTNVSLLGIAQRTDATGVVTEVQFAGSAITRQG